jgi:flavodoxin
MKGIVVYDSLTGNTQKIAEAVAAGSSFEIKKVDLAPLDLSAYVILVLCTPNWRAKPSEKIMHYIAQTIAPKKFALVVTFGMPIWGQLSSRGCLKKMRTPLEAKGSRFSGKFICPGFHVKYKTYKGRPAEKDFLRARRFAEKLTQST